MASSSSRLALDEPCMERLEFDATRAAYDTFNTNRVLVNDGAKVMNEVVYEISQRNRQSMRKEAIRTLSFVWAVLSW